MNINVLWLAGPNYTEKFTKNRNYLVRVILLAPSVYHVQISYTIGIT